MNENDSTRLKVTLPGLKLHSIIRPRNVDLFSQAFATKKTKQYVPAWRWHCCSVKSNWSVAAWNNCLSLTNLTSQIFSPSSTSEWFKPLPGPVLLPFYNDDGGGMNKVSTDAFCPLHCIEYHLIRPGWESFKCDSFYIACKHFVFFFKCW